MIRNPRQNAFSLPELLVVIGIIAILLGLLMPMVIRARQSAASVACRSNLRQLGQAIAMYADRHRGLATPIADNLNPPLRDTLGKLLFGEPYPRVLVCPTGIDTQRNSYAVNVWLKLNRAKLSDRHRGQTPSEVVLAVENRPGIEDDAHLPMPYPRVWFDPARHGRSLRSNYLWFDLHVSNEEPRFRPNFYSDLLYVSPQR